MAASANAFYVGVRYDNGTIISKPLTKANPYTTSATAVLRAYLESRLDMTTVDHTTVVVTDSEGAIRGSKGDGRYVKAVVDAIKSAFFRGGVSILRTDAAPASRTPTTQPVSSTTVASSPPPTPSFYATSTVFPKYKLVTT